MTSPQSIVVSLEWAKKLKESGWPHGGYFAWYIYPDLPPDQREPGVPEPHEEVEKHHDKGWKVKLEHYRAPTAEEILRRLPPIINKTRVLEIMPSHPDEWRIEYGSSHTLWEKTLANAAASMYVHLSENNLL